MISLSDGVFVKADVLERVGMDVANLKSNTLREESPLKLLPDRDINELGNVIFLKLTQPPNEYIPRLVIPSESVTSVRDEQLLNYEIPIVVTVPGMVRFVARTPFMYKFLPFRKPPPSLGNVILHQSSTLATLMVVIFEQSSNARSFTLSPVMPDGKVKLLREVHPLKA
jgi:hypothetical protein